jgi:hypothetical protein
LMVAHDAYEVVDLLRSHGKSQCEVIGDAMRVRALHQHTYSVRALQFDQVVASREAGTLNRGLRAVQPTV